MPIGVMTGMRTEAAIAARLLGADDHLVVTGGRAARAAALAAMLIEKRCGHVVSFGIAGGLDPHLPPGAIVLADAVLDGGARYACDAAWTGDLAAKFERVGIAAHRVPIAAADRAIATRTDKDALRQATGAGAVDMESGALARSATAHDRPLMVLRAIADPSWRAVPGAALVGLRDDGTSDGVAVLRALARAPAQLPGLIRLALDARRALRALARASIVMGPGFGLV